MRNKKISKREYWSESEITPEENSGSLESFGQGDLQELISEFSRRGQLKPIIKAVMIEGDPDHTAEIEEIVEMAEMPEMIAFTIRWIEWMQSLNQQERRNVWQRFPLRIRKQAEKVMSAID